MDGHACLDGRFGENAAKIGADRFRKADVRCDSPAEKSVFGRAGLSDRKIATAAQRPVARISPAGYRPRSRK